MRILLIFSAVIFAGCAARHDDFKGQTATTTITNKSAVVPMTPDLFKRIASAPGDETPLSPKLLATGPLWKNATVSIQLNYQDGKTFHENVLRTAKTIEGVYIVFTVQSQLYQQPMDSILTYDETASAYKIFGLYDGVLTEATVVYDTDGKTYASTATFGDGLVELGIGSRSDRMDSDRTFVYRNGILFMVRDTKTVPLPKT